MRVLDLNGSAIDRGRQQGEALREQFPVMLNTFMASELWRENKPWFLPDGLAPWLFGVLGRIFIRSAVTKLLPRQAQRIHGIAEGAGISSDLAWGLNFLEIIFCEAGKSLKVPGGCTQLHAPPSTTASGHPLLGRNYDFPTLLRDFQIVRREVPSEKDRLATTTITQFPLAGSHQGINEAGLALAANNARVWRGKDFHYKGVPYLLLMTEALETCRDLSEAVEFITRFPCRTNAGFIGIQDARGDCCVVEITATRTAIRRPDDSGTMAQTNHFHLLKDANLPRGTYWTVKGLEGLKFEDCTERRYEVADKRLREAAGQLDQERIRSILSDHSANNGVGNDETICFHSATGITLSSMIFDLFEKKLWVATGNPCESVTKQRTAVRTVKKSGKVLKFKAAAFYKDFTTIKGLAVMKKYMNKKVAITGTVLKGFDFGRSYQLWIKAGEKARLVAKFADNGAGAKKKGLKTGSTVKVLCKTGGRAGRAIHLSACVLQ